MKVSNIIICIALFLLGLWIGTLNSTVVEIEKRIEVEVKVPYLNLTDPELKDKLEVCANTLGLTIRDKEEIEKLHQKNKDEISKMYDDRRDEAEKIKHWQYQRGYTEGYRDGRGR